MSKRGQKVFLGAGLAWTTIVAAVGFLSAPRGVWSYAAAHAQGFLVQVVVVWVIVPATLLLAFGLVSAPRAPNRLIYGAHEAPKDHQRWQARILTVTALFMAFGQTWQTAALLHAWRTRSFSRITEALRVADLGGVSDPHHVLQRLWVAAGGLLIA